MIAWNAYSETSTAVTDCPYSCRTCTLRCASPIWSFCGTEATEAGTADGDGSVGNFASRVSVAGSDSDDAGARGAVEDDLVDGVASRGNCGRYRSARTTG